MEDYLKVYLYTDVWLLADVFEKFCADNRLAFEIDPAYYISLPQYSWDAMLKYIGAPIYLPHDAEMYRMIKSQIRGGISNVVTRHAKANNTYMGGLYDKEKPSSFIAYELYNFIELISIYS